MLLVISTIVPFVTNTVYIFHRFEIDVVPLSFAVSLLIFAIPAFKYRFLSIIPAALQNIFDYMQEAILVLEVSGRVVNFNSSFSELFKGINIKPGTDVNDFMDYICKNLCIEGDDVLINAVNKGTQKPVGGEIRFLYPEEKYYYVNVRPITGTRGDIIGRIVTFNDIMEYKL